MYLSNYNFDGYVFFLRGMVLKKIFLGLFFDIFVNISVRGRTKFF